MKRPQALGLVALGLLLGFGSFVGRGEASPYITHQTGEASKPGEPIRLPSWTSLPVSHPAIDVRRASSLELDFEPGMQRAIAATLPPPIDDHSEPLPIHQDPGDGVRTLPAAPPQKRTVPEPASIVLVVTGLIGLAARRYLLNHRPLA
ncbi:PEP-CTERM sorting domain-containing protein [Singulisphaera sp. Ch08]|uniref:PEP-CTERM sorting domain-containing protein n=1 Tax=Singulisphaera sp. Ch08 TaxID=3120278 RepID=A0AAU7CG51_9BACT